MLATMKVATILGIGVGLVITACGGEEKPPASPSTTASAAPAESPPPAATSAAPADKPAPSASAAPPPPPKGKFTTFAFAANSGKIDKIGTKDGNLKPDGLKDLVFDAEFEGAPIAFMIVSSDKAGEPNGEFSADTFVGDQQLPSELAANLNQGKFTAGLGVAEADKLLNAKDGSVTLPDGKHKLSFFISSKDAPKGSSYKAVAVFSDKTMVQSPTATPAAAATPAK